MATYDIFCKTCVRVYRVKSTERKVPRLAHCPKCASLAIAIVSNGTDYFEPSYVSNDEVEVRTKKSLHGEAASKSKHRP